MPRNVRFDPTRRDFVEQALALAGVALMGTAARAADASAPAPTTKPSEKVRVATAHFPRT